MHIGLIGAGNISQTHAAAVRSVPGARVAAVYSTNAEKTGRLAREHNAKSYSDFDAFLKHRPMDLVMIGSPSGLHAMHGIAAAQHGLHVLTEKPLDINTHRADTLIDAAKRAGVKLGVLFQDRTKSDIRRLKTWIDDGILGKVLLVDACMKWYRPPEYYSDSKWRGTLALDGGGALINQCSHTVDLLLWLLGDVARVQSRTVRALHKIEVEDTALAILDFTSGAVGTLQATTAAYPGYPRRIEISGTLGTVILEHDRIIAADLRGPQHQEFVSAGGDTNQSATSPVVNDSSGHQALLEDFLAAIRDDRPPICDGAEGRRSIALIESIYRAAR